MGILMGRGTCFLGFPSGRWGLTTLLSLHKECKREAKRKVKLHQIPVKTPKTKLRKSYNYKHKSGLSTKSKVGVFCL